MRMSALPRFESRKQVLTNPSRASRILGCGIDLVEIESLRRSIEVGGECFLERIYTKAERAYCRGQLSRLAARFAAKEAVAKALGTGIRGIRWGEIEILSDGRGRPLLYLSGRAAARARELGIESWAISLSHSETVAVALVVTSSIGRVSRGEASVVSA